MGTVETMRELIHPAGSLAGSLAGTAPASAQPAAAKSLRRRLGALSLSAALAVSLSGCLGYDGSLQHGYVLDENLLAQVHPGSVAEQVLAVMGTPSTTSTVGGSAWYYISQKTVAPLAFSRQTIVDQRVVAIYFDKTKKVERVANYGLQDGKVFDFVNRTTPTAGGEQAFLQNMLRNLLKV